MCTELLVCTVKCIVLSSKELDVINREEGVK